MHSRLTSIIPGIILRTNIILPWSVQSVICQVWPTHLSSHEDWLWKEKFRCQWTICLEQLTYWTSVTWHLTGRFQSQTQDILFNWWLSAFGVFILILRFTNVLNNNNNNNGGAKCKGGVRKNHDLQPISGFISELVQDRAIVTMEGE